MKELNAELLKLNIKRKLQCQEACKFFVGHYASIEIDLVLSRKCRLNTPCQPTVCYKCTNVNLLFYSTITVLSLFVPKKICLD